MGNIRVIILIYLPITLSRLNRFTDFNEISIGDTLIVEEGRRLLFTAITNIHVDGIGGKI